MVFSCMGHATLSRNNVEGKTCKIGESSEKENVPSIYQTPTDESKPHYLDKLSSFFPLRVPLETLTTFDKPSIHVPLNFHLRPSSTTPSRLLAFCDSQHPSIWFSPVISHLLFAFFSSSLKPRYVMTFAGYIETSSVTDSTLSELNWDSNNFILYTTGSSRHQEKLLVPPRKSPKRSPKVRVLSSFLMYSMCQI